MNISIIPRETFHLEPLVQLFTATHKANGYPVEGPPELELPESWPEFFASNDASAEVLGLVACQLEAGTGDGRMYHESVDSIAGQVVTTDSPSAVLGHVSVRRLPENSIVPRLWGDSAGNEGCADDMWEVCRLAVDPISQGKGIGWRLLQAVETYAHAKGKTLVLGVLEKDANAIQMYEKRGWRRFGQDKMIGQDGREWEEYFYVCPRQ